jgi:hypothetical protein
MRDLPLHERKPKRRLEEDPATRDRVTQSLPAPAGEAAFRDGWRECAEMFALHAPNKRGVRRILDEHCITLEQECMRLATRENYARYEGFRAAMKELRRVKRIK